jgi:hypothetical protein
MESKQNKRSWELYGKNDATAGNPATAPQSEIQFQAILFQWCWNTYPQTRRLLFHVPNGGKRGKIEAMQLKASGVIAGIPDLIFIWKGKMYAFELKTATGILSDNQKEVHAIWANHNVTVNVIRTLLDFQNIINSIIK